MLHAFARNKSKAYTRYLRVRDRSEPRVSSEDEIASIIFGPLDFLPASESWKLWMQVLHSHESNDRSGRLPSDFFADFSPSACTIEFWPRKDNIEPDLVISFSNADGEERFLLIELKWDSPLSGADQLEKQWLSYQNGQHANSLHIFIAKRMGDLAQSQSWSCQESDGSAASRLRRLRWHDFKHEITKLAGLPETSMSLRRWCVLASDFLRRVDIRPFVGFHTAMKLADAIPDGDVEPVRFWSRH